MDNLKTMIMPELLIVEAKAERYKVRLKYTNESPRQPLLRATVWPVCTITGEERELLVKPLADIYHLQKGYISWDNLDKTVTMYVYPQKIVIKQWEQNPAIPLKDAVEKVSLKPAVEPKIKSSPVLIGEAAKIPSPKWMKKDKGLMLQISEDLALWLLGIDSFRWKQTTGKKQFTSLTFDCPVIIDMGAVVKPELSIVPDDTHTDINGAKVNLNHYLRVFDGGVVAPPPKINTGANIQDSFMGAGTAEEPLAISRVDKLLEAKFEWPVGWKPLLRMKKTFRKYLNSEDAKRIVRTLGLVSMSSDPSIKHSWHDAMDIIQVDTGLATASNSDPMGYIDLDTEGMTPKEITDMVGRLELIIINPKAHTNHKIIEKVKLHDFRKGEFHTWLGKNVHEPITLADINKGLASTRKHIRQLAQEAMDARSFKKKQAKKAKK